MWFWEKLAHFDREVIPERRMHAKGSGAYRAFTVRHDIRKYTRNTARSIREAPKEIQLRHIANCLKADQAYGKGIADALGIALTEVEA